MPSPFADYLIVGGGVAGGHAVYGIRKRDKSGKIIVINKEDHFPYDRPPLSKEYLAGKKKRKEVFFRADSYYRRNKVEFICGAFVQAIDLTRRSATLDDGREISYKVLLLATGGIVRKLELPGSELEGIFYLRTIEDCEVIKKASKNSKRVVIVGGGFIGCEVAATLRGKGLKVTLVHRSPQLLSAAIDQETARWIKDYHTKKGVEILLNTNIKKFVGKDGRVNAVELDDGKRIPADFVVVGIGVTPNTGLAERAGLEIDNGVPVNEFLETRTKGVYAAGDIARFYSPVLKRNFRVEHVDVAQKQGNIAGINMTGMRQPYAEVPYFFSNQFDLEINVYGDLTKFTEVVRRGKLDAKAGFIQFYFNGRMLDGTLSVNADWGDIESAKSLLELQKEFTDPHVMSDESIALKKQLRAMAKTE